MREVAANLSQEGENWLPREVYHVQLGLRWTVLEVLQAWVHPRWPERTYRNPAAERKYRLRVRGPLPGRPHEQGEFIMIATAYGNRDHFWIKPEAPRLREPGTDAAGGPRPGSRPPGRLRGYGGPRRTGDSAEPAAVLAPARQAAGH